MSVFQNNTVDREQVGSRDSLPGGAEVSQTICFKTPALWSHPQLAFSDLRHEPWGSASDTLQAFGNLAISKQQRNGNQQASVLPREPVGTCQVSWCSHCSWLLVSRVLVGCLEEEWLTGGPSEHLPTSWLALGSHCPEMVPAPPAGPLGSGTQQFGYVGFILLLKTISGILTGDLKRHTTSEG